MRQIEEFSDRYRDLGLSCILWTGVLVVWIWICSLLHWRGMDMSLPYSLVATVIGYMLLKSVAALRQEELRLEQAYIEYLDSLSWQEMRSLSRNQHLSSWSKREIARYLNQALRLQF